MDPNLTYSIFVNPTLNATLYQPDAGLDGWLQTNFLAIVQVVTAVALAYLTFELLKATSRYADQVETQTDIMKRNTELSQKTMEIDELNRERERIIKEMDKLIGPLYSRINDKQIFNPLGISGRYFTNSSSGEINKKLYEEGAFWQEIARYKYLAPINLRSDLDKYLDIKIKSTKMWDGKDPLYIESEKNLRDAVEIRYSEIESRLSRMEPKVPTSHE